MNRRNPLLIAAVLMALGTDLPPPRRREEPGPDLPPDLTFHGHLDACARCRNEPHNLCPTGAALLKREATGGAPT